MSKFRAVVVVSLTAWTIVSWTAAAEVAIHRPIPSDFTHFYTLGAVALERGSGTLYNEAALAARQAAVVPRSEHQLYLPLYPPQTAILFAPFAVLPFTAAAVTWAAISAAVYLLLVRFVWRRVRVPAADVAVLATLGFPAFWHLITFGQNTVIVLAAFCVGWIFLERDRRVLAGIAFGAIGFKPQFALLMGIVMLCRREWRMLAGAALSGALQVALASAVFGVHVFVDYAAYIPQIAAHANIVEQNIERTASLRAVSRLLPARVGLPLWAVGVMSVVWLTVASWRASVPVRVRLAVVILGSILISPHGYVYDLVLLVLPLLWLAPALEGRREIGVICALFVSLAATLPISVWSESLARGWMVASVGCIAAIFVFAVECATREFEIGRSFRPLVVNMARLLPRGRMVNRRSVVKVSDVQ